MSDFISFIGFMAGLCGVVFGFSCLVVAITDSRAEDRCYEFGRVSGIEVAVKHSYCFLNDPELGWITYQERLESRTAERGLSHEGS